MSFKSPLRMLPGYRGREAAMGMPLLDWYVDSVKGDDTKSGKSPGQAFKTIAALEAAGIAAWDQIGLAAGSHWREQLDITVDHVTVKAYGSGNRPILDASDVVGAGSWSKTGGQTNVYETDVTITQFSVDEWVNVWEDDTFLARVADVATCDTTPGSYYPTAESGNITIYIHPYGSTDPTSDGKTYEYTARALSLHSTGQYTMVESIRTRRNQNSSGSTRVAGRYGTLRDCHFDDGNKHNVYVFGGAELYNCVATDAYHGANDTSLFVFNEGDPEDLPVSFYDCTAQCTTLDATLDITGWLGHTNTPGATFGLITYDGCTVQNCKNGFSVGKNVSTPNVMQNCTVQNYSNIPIAVYGDVTIDGLTITGSGNRIMNIETAATVIVSNLTTLFSGGGVTMIYSSQACDLTLSDSELGINVNNSKGIQFTNAAAALDMQRVVFSVTAPATQFAQQCILLSTQTLNLDYNTYQREYWNWDGGNINNFATWKATTGQDAHSTVG